MTVNPLFLGLIYKNVFVTRRSKFQSQRNELVEGVQSQWKKYGDLIPVLEKSHWTNS